MAAVGLTGADGMAKAWFVDENGRLSSGAHAINEAMRFCWWIRPFTHLYHIPGIHQLQEHIYQWIANNRHRLPGSTPQCEMPEKHDAP
ncbi:MAG: DUF393 domain-containing protein [Chloroflexi bacterium]|nr:MAG: DUF393 domain-containing protein [Chloroflexota bacterium]